MCASQCICVRLCTHLSGAHPTAHGALRATQVQQQAFGHALPTASAPPAPGPCAPPDAALYCPRQSAESDRCHGSSLNVHTLAGARTRTNMRAHRITNTHSHAHTHAPGSMSHCRPRLQLAAQARTRLGPSQPSRCQQYQCSSARAAAAAAVASVGQLGASMLLR